MSVLPRSHRLLLPSRLTCRVSARGNSGGEPKLGTSGGEPKLGNSGGEPKLGNSGGEPKLGNSGGEPKLGNSGGEPKLEHENPFRLPAYHPTAMDKMILVHFRYYPDIKSVPTRVHGGVMEVAKSKARIKMSLVMMLGTVVGCGYMMWYGRKHSRNYSLIEHNALRHQKYRAGEPDSSIGHKALHQDHKDEVETAILKHELHEAKKKLEALEKKE